MSFIQNATAELDFSLFYLDQRVRVTRPRFAALV